jgi:hypothetical protein
MHSHYRHREMLPSLSVREASGDSPFATTQTPIGRERVSPVPPLAEIASQKDCS